MPDEIPTVKIDQKTIDIVSLLVEAKLVTSKSEARRLMEKTMAGFPSEYAKKLELSQTASLVKELKDTDLEAIKKLISIKLSISDYDTKHETLMAKYDGLNEKAQGWETIKADINGRLWTLSFVMVGTVALTVSVLEFIFRFGLSGFGK